MRDILGAIAQARAQMMMRGYTPLRLEIGYSTLRQLQSEVAPNALFLMPDGDPANEVLGMPLTERLDMEGFKVLPANPD